MFKKYVLIITTVLLLIISSTGCENKVDKQVAQLDTQANECVSKGNLSTGIELYNKSLSLKNDSTISKKLADAKTEKEAVDTVKQLFTDLKSINTNINSAYGSEDIMKLIKPTENDINNLNSIDQNKSTEISKFVKTFSENPEFQLFKSDYVSGKTIQTDYEDIITLNSKKLRVKIIISDLLKTNIPEKYNN